jgi:hypothetical protein
MERDRTTQFGLCTFSIVRDAGRQCNGSSRCNPKHSSAHRKAHQSIDPAHAQIALADMDPIAESIQLAAPEDVAITTIAQLQDCGGRSAANVARAWPSSGDDGMAMGDEDADTNAHIESAHTKRKTESYARSGSSSAARNTFQQRHAVIVRMIGRTESKTR